jgi:hypothetical protein
MAFIPKGAFWFIADVVEELHVAGRKRQTVYINTFLIKASSPEDAYTKSLKIGREANTSYKNMYGEMVNCRFRGLLNLNVIHEKLGHGCEFFYRSKPRLTLKGIRRLITKKNELGVFADIRRKNKRLFPKWIAEELARRRKRNS